jgi:hypothetical protein
MFSPDARANIGRKPKSNCCVTDLRSRCRLIVCKLTVLTLELF